MVIKPTESLGPVSQAKREQILAAAQRLFLERGYEGTSMEAIREVADVSKPTLYNHYASKEVLFAAVLGTIIDTIGGDWLPAVEADALPLYTSDELHTALLHIAQHALTGLMRSGYLALLRVVVAEMGRFPELGTIFRAAGPDRGLDRLATLFVRAHNQGIVRVPDPDMAARLFFGPLLTYTLLDGLLAADTPALPPSERLTVMVDLFMQAINNGT